MARSVSISVTPGHSGGGRPGFAPEFPVRRPIQRERPTTNAPFCNSKEYMGKTGWVSNREPGKGGPFAFSLRGDCTMSLQNRHVWARFTHR